VRIAAASSIRRTNGTACFGSYSYRATRLTREERTRYTAVPLQLAAEIGALVGKRGCGAFFTQAAEKESTHPRQIQALEGVAVFPTGAPRPGSRSNHRAKGGRWWGGLVAAYIECGQCCLHQACFAPHGVRQGAWSLAWEKRVLEDPRTVEDPAQPVGEQAGLETRRRRGRPPHMVFIRPVSWNWSRLA